MLRRRRITSHWVMSLPSNSTRPLVGSISRLMSFMVVVLPEPLVPIRDTVSPAATSRVSPLTAATSLPSESTKTLETSRSSIKPKSPLQRSGRGDHSGASFRTHSFTEK